MRNQSIISNINLLLILCSCFAMGCNNSNSNTSKNEGELTEQIVKDYFTNFHMKDCNQLYDCKVSFETSVEIGSSVRRNISGALPPPDGGWPIVYPVKVDVSFYKRDIDVNAIGMWTRYKGGVHYFYQDANSIWLDAPEGVAMTLENDTH